MRLRWAVVLSLAAFVAFVLIARAQIQNEVIESGGYHRYPGGIAIGDPASGVGCLNWSQVDMCFFLDSNCNFTKDMGEACYCLCTTTSTSTSSTTSTILATTTSTVVTTTSIVTVSTIASTTSIPTTSLVTTTITTTTSTTTSTLVFALVGGHSALASTASPYLPLSSWDEGPCTTFTACATMLEHDQTIDTWSLQASSSMSGDQVLVGHIVYDPPGATGETQDNTMEISLGAGEIGGVSDGALVLPQGTLVALKFVFTGTGFTSKTVRSTVFGITGRPFLAQSIAITSTPSGMALAGMGEMLSDGGDYEQSDGTINVSGSLNPLPGDVSITGAGIHIASSLVTDSTFDLYQQKGGAANGQIDLDAGAVSAITNIFDWPVNTDWQNIAAQSDLNDHMNYWKGNMTATRRTQIATSYLPNDPYRHYSIALSGLGWSDGAGWAQGAFPVDFMIGAGPDQTNTQTRYIRWPDLPGTFKYMLIYAKANYASPNTVSLTGCLYCGGVCRITTATGIWSLASTNNPIWARNDVSAYHIVANETCEWHFTATGAGSPTFKMGVSIGFLPDSAPGATTTSTSTSSTSSTTSTSTSSTTSTSL